VQLNKLSTKNPGKISIKRLSTLVLFSIAFAYIEAAVVVYLRAIFYPDGFTFPIMNFLEMPGAGRYVITEIGREAATVVLMVTASLLMADKRRHRLAYFLIIFAVWDIFYYVWLKVLINWPASILDWDILFLIPLAWAGPVLAPVITSLTMLLIAALLLSNKTIKLTRPETVGLIAAGLAIIVLFCLAGLKITEPDYKSCFSWPIFIILHAAVVIVLFRATKNR
jgi:hypothetical protein